MTDITETGAQRYNAIGAEYNDTFTNEQLADLNSQLDAFSQLNAKQERNLLYSPTPAIEDKTKEAIESGYGLSMFDKDLRDSEMLSKLDDYRGYVQPWYAQIGAGVAKAGVLAGTTFSDGVAGTVFGVVNVGKEFDNIRHSDSPLRDTGKAFVNNWWSNLMQTINEKSEELLPNYYTQAEREDPWYQHIFSANFIGDKFLKNTGFIIGAAYAGKVNAGILSKALGLNDVRNAFKGVVTTASGHKLTSGSEIAAAYAAGDAFMDGVKMTDDLAKAAKNLKNAEIALKIAGSASAAAGEGRIEAISNVRDWENMHRQQLYNDYARKKENLEFQLFQERPDLFRFVQSGDAELGFTYNKIISPEGQAILNERSKQLDLEYAAALGELGKRSAAMANEIFLANLILLSADNAIQAGRFFSGGYTEGRNFLNLLKSGEYATNKGALVRKGIRTAINPLIEGNEEMAQSFISTAAGLQQAAKLNEFYGYKIDPEATEDLIEWYNASAQALRETYGNPDSWEEGFVGLISGLLPIPAFSFAKNEQGKNKLKVSFDGEFWQGISDMKALSKEQQEMLGKINEVVQSDKFKNYFSGTIRDRKIKEDKNKQLEVGDMFNYKNSELKEIVNWAIMFDKAGRIQDLYDNIDEFSNIKEEDIATIRQSTVDKKTGKSIYDGMTDEEIIAHFKHEGQQIKESVDAYVETSRNLKSLYGENIDEDTLAEISYTLLQVSDWEKRFSELLTKVRSNATLQALDKSKRLFGKNIPAKEKVLDEIDALNNPSLSAEDILTNLTSAEWNKILQDNAIYIQKHRKSLKDITGLLGDLTDLGKIFNARLEFIQKYNTLMNHPELFTKESIELLNKYKKELSDKIINDVVEGAKNPENVKDYTSFKAYVLEQSDDRSVDDVLDAFIASDDNTLKQYATQYKKMREVSGLVDAKVESLPPSVVNNASKAVLANILANSETPEDVFTQLDEAIAKATEANNNEQKALFEDIKKDLEQQLKSRAATSAVKTTSKPEKELKAKKKPTSADTENLFGKLNQGIIDTSKESDESDSESEDSIEKLIEAISQMEESDLQDIISGKSKLLEKLSDEDKKDIKELAQKVLDNKNKDLPLLPPVDVNTLDGSNADDNAGPSDVTTDEGDKEQKEYIQALRSWKVTKYNIDKAKKENRAVLLNSDQEGIEDSDVSLMKALDNIGAYDFVDKGYLGELLQKLGVEKLPIRYIIKNDGTFQGNVLLGIEITDEVRKAIGDKAFTPITTPDGTQYQIVGTLGFNKDNPKAIEAERKINEKIKKASTSLRTPENKDNGDYWVYQDEVNYIKHIYSGRMVLADDAANSMIIDKRPVTKEYLESGARIGVWYNDSMHSSLDPEKETIVPLNPHNETSRDGSVWLLTKEADGRWYAKGLRRKRFGISWDIKEHRDTPFGKRLIEYSKVLVNQEASIIKRTAAKRALEEILYIPDNVQILFKDGIVSIKVDGKTFANNVATSDDIDTRAEEFLNALQNPELNLGFQVDAGLVSDNSTDGREYIDSLIDSDVLETNLPISVNGTKNINASFDLYLSEEDAKGNLETTVITGHTGGPVSNVRKAEKSVFVDGQKYTKTTENDWREGEASSETIVEDPSFLEDIMRIEDGTLSPIGNSKTYKLNDGSLAKKINGGYKRITGEEAKKELDKLQKQIDRQTKADNIKKGNVSGSTFLRKDDVTEGGSPGAEPMSLFGDDSEDEAPVKPEPKKEDSITYDQQSQMSVQELNDMKNTIPFVNRREGRTILRDSGISKEGLEQYLGKDALNSLKDSNSLIAAINDYKHCRH